MLNKGRFPNVMFGARLRPDSAALAIMVLLLFLIFVFLFLTLTAQPAQAQTYRAIHDFTGGEDGAAPYAGLTMDEAESLYGTTCGGPCTGGNDPGTVFRLSRTGSGWVFTRLYRFAGGNDGAAPLSKVIFGPDGSLYGTTAAGGIDGGCSFFGTGCGTVFKLTPPAQAAASVAGGWTETVLYRFTGGIDGANPGFGDLTFDQAGNLYGTTIFGGVSNQGTVFELTPFQGGWRETVLYSLEGYDANPFSGVVFDQSGRLYGTTSGYFCEGCVGGTVYRLDSSANGWVANTLHVFQNGHDGVTPIGGLILDRSSHGSGSSFYGTTSMGGDLGGGTVFGIDGPSGTLFTIQSFQQFWAEGFGPTASMVTDPSGQTFFGQTYQDGPDGEGTFFHTDWHCVCGECWLALDEFGTGGAFGSPLVGEDYNLYFTTVSGGAHGAGAVVRLSGFDSDTAAAPHSECSENNRLTNVGPD